MQTGSIKAAKGRPKEATMIKATRLLILASLLCALCMPPVSSARDDGDYLRDFLDGKLASAEALLKDEQYAEALKLADALIVLSPDPEWTRIVEKFRHRLLDERMRGEVLECRVVPDKKVYVAGETVRLTVRFYNRGMGEVVIPLPEKDGAAAGGPAGRPNRMLLTITTRDFDALGSVLTTTRDIAETIEEEIRLGPGDFWEKPIETEGVTGGVGRRVSRKVVFSVTLAPVIMKQGGRTRMYAPYKSAEAGIVVVPEGARGALADPEAALRRAVTAGDAEGIFHAAMLLSLKKPNLTLRLLAAALRRSRANSAVERAVIVGMQHGLGTYRLRTRDSWLEWWDRAWTYYCADDDARDARAVKIALIKTDNTYLITLEGKRCSLRELAQGLGEAVARGAVRCEIRCSRDVAFAQFIELHRAAREAGLKDIRVLYADTVKP